MLERTEEKLTSDDMKSVVGGNGAGIDPNGGTTEDTGDIGCGIDPNG